MLPLADPSLIVTSTIILSSIPRLLLSIIPVNEPPFSDIEYCCWLNDTAPIDEINYNTYNINLVIY